MLLFCLLDTVVKSVLEYAKEHTTLFPLRKFSPILFVSLLLILSISAMSVAQEADDLIFIDFDIDSGEEEVEVELEIEEGDVSVFFHVTADDPDAWVGLYAIYDEDDNLLYDIDSDLEDNDINFGFSPYTEDNFGELGVFMPAAPQYELEVGVYYFIFGAEDGNLETITAIIRSGDMDVQQAIDINLWVLSEESDLQSSNTQNEFEGVLRGHIDDLLNPHDLELGALNFIDASDSDLDDFAYPEIDDDDVTSLNDLCERMTEVAGTSRALNVALIDGFDEPGDGGTAGVSINAGNSGVMYTEGSRHSCVVVSWEAYEDDFSSQAANIIHEASHFMSLPHTTEAEGDVFDIFDDTPECEFDDFSSDDDDVVDDFECGIAGGAQNYMFWNGDPDAGLAPYTMSADQAWVLRRFPLFYTVED